MKEQIIIGVSIFVLLVIATILMYIAKDYIKSYFPKIKYLSSRYWYKFRLFVHISRAIYKNVKTPVYGSILVNLIFDVFIFYYEHNLVKEAHGLAFPENDFPNGFTDIYNMYRWIIDTRDTNYRDIYSIEYDEEKDAFEFYNQYFESFKFSLRASGELNIKPIQYIEDKNKEMKFLYKRMSIINKLYDLDNKKAQWILERRRYFSV